MNIAFALLVETAAAIGVASTLRALPAVAAIGGDLFGWWEWRLLLIPPITGIIGYITNYVAIYMLFHPLRFKGFDVPGMEKLTVNSPYRIRQIPGMLEGRVGWQGIIPSKARKMGSINVDTAIGKITTQTEIFQELDPDLLADHIYESAGDDIKEMVVETIREQNPELWDDAPEQVHDAVRSQVDDQLPEIIQHITEHIGEHVDELFDTKMMVIEHLDEHPEHVNEIFLETGDKEFDFIVNSGFYFGTLLGIFSIPAYVIIGSWWVLPLFGVFVGYTTNWLALKMIFRPLQRHDIGPFTLQGIFLRRQDVASETYAEIVAREIITLENIADNLMYGPNSDRTRQLIREDLRESIDDMFGADSPVVRVLGGTEEYEAVRDEVAENGVEYAVSPLQEPEINEARRSAIERLLASRMKELPPDEFAHMLRSAFKEDEWLLIACGAALGFVAGWIQLLVVTTV
ncbi:hypothetical protein HWV07_15035 [Natronomonas salina]|uniref:hypothetical protein n=1 Tax=Natronomonas salina TaxID=1710540 RepID=UPI0015B5A514|nr:hypothetical protein [Natronomonas salina]QLD90277.1 hypothetical protein HWV07_15035 [Natronomonas salina]